MDYASAFRTARERAGISQSQAAEAWGITLKSLQNWEQGVSTPSGQQLAKLWPIINPPAAPVAKPKQAVRKRKA